MLGTGIVIFLSWIGINVAVGLKSEDNEFTAKHEWSIVQNALSNRAGIRLTGPTIIEESGVNLIKPRKLLGVPTKDGKRNVWILLDAKASPKVKSLPADDPEFALTKAEYTAIEAHVGTEEVRHFLRQHIVGR